MMSVSGCEEAEGVGMKRLKALWLLLWLPRASVDEAHDALLAMRDFWRDPLDIAATTTAEEISVQVGAPVLRPEFTIDVDEWYADND